MKPDELLQDLSPGEILLENYMKPMGLTQRQLAMALDVSPRRVNEIIHDKRAITLDTSIRLGVYFGQSPQFWLNIQNECDLHRAPKLIKQIVRVVKPFVFRSSPSTPEAGKKIINLRKATLNRGRETKVTQMRIAPSMPE